MPVRAANNTPQPNPETWPKKTQSGQYVKVALPASQAKALPRTLKWSKERVLKEARRRTREVKDQNQSRLQEALAILMKEAGWNENDFIEALCKDVMSRGAH